MGDLERVVELSWSNEYPVRVVDHCPGPSDYRWDPGKLDEERHFSDYLWTSYIVSNTEQDIVVLLWAADAALECDRRHYRSTDLYQQNHYFQRSHVRYLGGYHIDTTCSMLERRNCLLPTVQTVHG